MPVTTLSAAFHITPTVIKTFIEHTQKKGKKLRENGATEEATDDLFFDEAFHIVKAFIEMGTRNTVESLQSFTNTHVPSPYWAAVSPVLIPLASCNKAADVLIDWFGPVDIKRVVGGEKWWQVRGLAGVDGEWIAEKEFLTNEKVKSDKKLTDDEKDILRMEQLETVMLYVHGGGYFWGSINTHRYQIIRYARKFRGRAFAVNYRKAPQYPWPCPVQDVLAAYLYLIDPPPTAIHKPVPPSKIVLAGDSAGGGLCLTVLTVLRDMGLPMPAGAVLISPWVDLTHSFPSIMNNTETDIIPPHGFLAKPSTLWPVEPLPPAGSARIMPAKRGPPPEPGHADTLTPSTDRVKKDVEKSREGKDTIGEELGRAGSQEEKVQGTGAGDVEKAPSLPDADDIDFWQPKPPKVLMDDPHAVPLELRSQIQLYATNEQLTHPLVSPVLQGSLGNLPPLYILAGDKEVLRDEIVYMAHRAAHPDQFPAREGVLRDGRRQQENADKFTTPTKVHLQVFDDMCHVLTVFMFTNSAKYAYRSIAEFIKHVTSHSEEHLGRNPFPELHRPPSAISTDSNLERAHSRKERRRSAFHWGERKDDNLEAEEKDAKEKEPSPGESSGTTGEQNDIEMYRENEQAIVDEVKEKKVDEVPASMGVSEPSLSSASLRNETRDIPNILMIRERVDIHGHARAMEPKEEIAALQLRPAEIGIIKEGPCLRWAAGQEKWDKRYKHSAQRVIKKRKRNEAEAKRMLANARDQGLLLAHDPPSTPVRRPTTLTVASSSSSVPGAIQGDRRYGPLDLAEENPPPTSIAKRRDTKESLALLKSSIYHSVPVTHKTVPKLKTIDAIRAAFDPDDDPMKPPRHSASEQQTQSHLIPMHGLRVWDALLGYFMRTSSKKALRGTKHAAEAVHRAGERLGVLESDSNTHGHANGERTKT
ncbi:hypothetical protein PLICRDRAFT_33764 [Plicaturopsis crispa FD-325 SS-3]|nr:hypothetical protein PLICRDRAFT_33764 [Plicaturopsis crispa FD-325 SS-3]